MKVKSTDCWETTKKVRGCSEGGHENGWCNTRRGEGPGEMEADDLEKEEGKEELGQSQSTVWMKRGGQTSQDKDNQQFLHG